MIVNPNNKIIQNVIEDSKEIETASSDTNTTYMVLSFNTLKHSLSYYTMFFIGIKTADSSPIITEDIYSFIGVNQTYGIYSCITFCASNNPVDINENPGWKIDSGAKTIRPSPVAAGLGFRTSGKTVYGYNKKVIFGYLGTSIDDKIGYHFSPTMFRLVAVKL